MVHYRDWRKFLPTLPPITVILGLAAGVLLLIFGVRGLLAQSAPAVEPGSDVAIHSEGPVDFELPDFSGRTIHLSDYRGHPVLVNLWAAWCPPCRAEMPDLVRFYQAHQAEGVILLAVDSADTRQKAEAFMQNQPMPFPVLFDPKGRLMDSFGVQGLPSTFVVDTSGKVRFAWTGQITPGILESRIVPLIQE